MTYKRHNERGASGTEMALILLLIVTVAFAAVGFFGNSVTDKTEQIPGAFDGEVYDPGNTGGGGGDGGGGGETVNCHETPENTLCDDPNFPGWGTIPP